jgi:hypothetical protein
MAVAPGNDPMRSYSGDGQPVQIRIERLGRQREKIDAILLGKYDLDADGNELPEGGLFRDCELHTTTDGTDAYECLNEYEWQFFAVRGILRVPEEALSKREPFEMKYVAVETDRGSPRGYSGEIPESGRTFDCAPR